MSARKEVRKKMGKGLASLVFFFGLLSFFFIHPFFGIPFILFGGIFMFKGNKKPREEKFEDIEGRRIVIYY